MSKTTSRTAETTLTIRGVVDLDHPKTESSDGDGEVEIRVRSQSSGLRITVSMIVPVDGQDDDAIMEFAANVTHDDFPDMLGFEKTIRAMGPNRDATICAIERIYSDAVDRLGMKPGRGIQQHWEKLLAGPVEDPCDPEITETGPSSDDAYFLRGLADMQVGGDGSVAARLLAIADQLDGCAKQRIWNSWQQFLRGPVVKTSSDDVCFLRGLAVMHGPDGCRAARLIEIADVLVDLNTDAKLAARGRMLGMVLPETAKEMDLLVAKAANGR